TTMLMKVTTSVVAVVLSTLGMNASYGQTVIDIVKYNKDTVALELPKPDTLFSLRGKILESSRGDPLAGASVELQTHDSVRRQASDDEGIFRFNGIRRKTCYVVVSFIGYKTIKIKIEGSVDTTFVTYL